MLTGCASAAGPSDPTGVDQLTIPLPSAEQTELGPEIDNPWMPLASGTRARFRVGTDERWVTVRPAPVRVAGVEARAVETGEQVDYLAQDEDGNVWWLGREGEWAAGEDGAQAGLLMPAEPRVGDGFATSALDGRPTEVATVVSAEGSLLIIERRGLASASAAETVETYADGIGLIRREPPTGEPWVRAE